MNSYSSIVWHISRAQFWRASFHHSGADTMKLSIKLHELENEFIASCPELDVNCYGSNRGEAIRRLRNVLQFYIDSAHEFGLEVESFDDIFIEGEIQHALFLAENLPSSKVIN